VWRSGFTETVETRKHFIL